MGGIFNIDFGSIITGVGKVADDLFTSDEERARLALQGKALDKEIIIWQMEVNKTEAQHKSVLVAGWRPAMGWIGALSLGYQFIMYPLMLWFWRFGQAKQLIPAGLSPPPMLNTGALMSVVTGMLGIGAMRSFDKVKGVNTDKIQ